ncbi:MAG: transcriptional regulator [Acidobacteria bacterium]|nr:MAG: transcriptional regulator [Acidobacteriota bacterium]
MIRLSKRTDYGLMAMRHLAFLPRGDYRSAREIAAEYRIPPALTAKLLQRLARRGLVASHHGTKGGYQIARPPSQITLWDVIEAIEGPVGLTECLHASRGECPQTETCTVKRPLLTVHRKIAEVLERTTIGDL